MSSKSYGEELSRLKIALEEELKSTSHIIMHAEVRSYRILSFISHYFLHV